MNRSFSSLAIKVAVTTCLLLAKGVARADDPTTADCLHASDAAITLDNQHKLRAERAQLLVCAAAACPADIRRECVSRIDEVNAQVPTIIFGTKDASGAELRAVRVTMDGEVLAERLEGTALSIDPGEHTFTFETAGQAALSKELVIQQGQKDRREAITFGGGASPPGPVSLGPTKAPYSVSADERQGGLGTQRILAIAAGGVGVVGLGLGTAFGLMAMSKKSDALSACPNACVSQDGVDKWSSASSAGNISTIGFIVGGLGIAGAAALWFTAPRSNSGSSREVGLGPGGVQVRGTW